LKKIILVILLVFQLGACNSEALYKVIQSVEENELIESKVVKVVDGDTIKVNIDNEIITVRILNIDTPEVYGPNAGQPFGKEASKFAKEMLEGKTITLELSKKKNPYDKYGRLLAYVFIDKNLYEELIIEEGLARIAYVYDPDTKYLNVLENSERRAKNTKKNIWSIKGYVDESGYNKTVK
jgi:micrococcal nuclease